MKRTLLAIGIAVLASMLFAPHTRIWGFRGFGEWGAFYWKTYPVFVQHTGEYRDWMRDPTRNGDIIWPTFLAQTAFAAVLAAVLVNLRKSAQPR
jgi:hypothetical protein